MASEQYWDNRYSGGGNSGDGSYGEALQRKLDWLTGLDGVKSITDVGCGDFNFGKHLLELYPDAHYIGTDISEFIIQKNKKDFPQYVFTNTPDIPPADLILCTDVLLHVLTDEELESLLSKLEKVWTKYLVLTAYERDEEMTNHVRIRKFDYKRFGEPVLREVCEEDGQMYFYIFRK